MADQDRLIVLGVIKGAHGVRGDVRVKSFTENPGDLFQFGALRDDRGEILLTPKSHRAAKDHFIVRPQENKQKEAWDALKGTLLHVSRRALPHEDEGEFYIEDLIGIHVYTHDATLGGRVKAVQNFGAGDLLEIEMPGQPGTVFVPFTQADVPVVDVPESRIIIPNLSEWADSGEEK